MVVPFSFGPSVSYNVQPSVHWLPSVFAGPFRSLHLRTSKLARWLLAASAVQTTPLLSMSIPRGSKPGSGTLNSCVLHVAGAFAPRCRRMRYPGYRSLTPHTVSSTGLGITEYMLELTIVSRFESNAPGAGWAPRAPRPSAAPRAPAADGVSP